MQKEKENIPHPFRLETCLDIAHFLPTYALPNRPLLSLTPYLYIHTMTKRNYS